MREYRNRDNKTNDEETDPCIAAEVRMKKSALSSRARRSLVALLVILAVIASLSVLLFLILPRSKATSDGVRYKGYDLFEVPAETTAFVTAPSSAILYRKDADVVTAKRDDLSRETASFHESESRDQSSPVDERHPHDELPILQPVRFEVRDFTISASPDVTSDMRSKQGSLKDSGVEATKLLATTTVSTFVVNERLVTTNAEPNILELRTTAVPPVISTVPIIARTLVNPDQSSSTKRTMTTSAKNTAASAAMASTTTAVPFTVMPSARVFLPEESVTAPRASETTVGLKSTTSSPTLITTLAEKQAEPQMADGIWSTVPPTGKPASSSASTVDQKTRTVGPTTAEQQTTSLGVILGVTSTNLPVDASDEQEPTPNIPDLTSLGDAETCEAHFARGERKNGIYSLALPKIGRFEAPCDMTTTDGGWNVIQRRVDGAIEFDTRTWDEYERGFGQLNTSFWLGLEKIYALVYAAKGRPLTLRIELRGDRCSPLEMCSQLTDGFWFGEWDFKIGSATERYVLSVSPAKAGNLTEHTFKDKFHEMHDGQMFTTIDRDNDSKPNKNCAEWRFRGGWWHRDCGHIALNGRYNDTSRYSIGLSWLHYVRVGKKNFVDSYVIKPRVTEMKVRLNF